MSAFSSPAPELLAPAGDWDCVRAAIENGADAIYFGLDCGFNARARAQNFGLSDLPDVMRQLHRRGLRGYVTLNTLVFPSELPQIAEALRQIAGSGVDAVLVQDLGLARLVRQTCPELEIHASTQMTMTSSEGIEVARRLGVSRVVLARELSIAEIRKIRTKTDMPLEVFVHGALCVAYSGQCLTSESLGGRSANRGQCAQACRLPYELLVDGELRDLGEVRYLLSPQDLAAYALVPELIDAGVCSLKIEGRLKTAEYVANITRHYRTAIDEAIAGRPVQFTERQVHEMELSFSRGFSPGWLQGCDHKMLVPGDNSAKRGVRLGEVLSVNGPRVLVRLEAAVARGDGVAFEGDRSTGADQGGRVYELSRRGKSVSESETSQGTIELAFDTAAVDTSRIYAGQRVWKTDDPRLRRRLRSSFNTADPIRRTPVDLRVTAVSGQRLHIHATTVSGIEVVVESDSPLEQARRHPASDSGLREQFERLGGTPFELRALEARIEGEPMIPHSVSGTVRRVLVERLIEAAEFQSPRRIDPDALAHLQLGPANDEPAAETRPSSQPREESRDDALEDALEDARADARADSGDDLIEDRPLAANEAARLFILCRTQAQLRAAIEAGARHLYADFHDIREYAEAVRIARAAGVAIYLATLRIQKPGELGLARKLLRLAPDGLLVRNLASLEICRAAGVVGIADFSLNVANHLTADFLRANGAARMTVSYDLNRDQLGDLVSAVPGQQLEIVVHQHMPMFHMEHCVFCSVLSPGTNKTNCGRPCDTHLVKLRDRIGMDHPLQADVGCRNTLYNAVPQSGAEVVPEMLAAGVRAFRVELLEDDAAQTRRVIDLYARLLVGAIEPKEVWKELKAANRVGVTRGTLEQRRNPLAIV